MHRQTSLLTSAKLNCLSTKSSSERLKRLKFSNHLFGDLERSLIIDFIQTFFVVLPHCDEIKIILEHVLDVFVDDRTFGISAALWLELDILSDEGIDARVLCL